MAMLQIESWPGDHPRWPEVQQLIDTLEQTDWVAFVADWHLASAMLVAVQADRVVGFLRYVVQPLAVEEDLDAVVLNGEQLCEAKVLAFGVAAAMRRRGIGRALQVHLIAEARAQNLFQIRSHSSAANVANHCLKLSLGYAMHALHPGSGRDGAYFLLPLRTG